LKRYGIIDRLTQDIKDEKLENKETALAAAIMHSEYLKSRVKNSSTGSSSWKNKLG
jgi:acetyl-CoA/propionyl-CoA carboxylase